MNEQNGSKDGKKDIFTLDLKQASPMMKNRFRSIPFLEQKENIVSAIKSTLSATTSSQSSSHLKPCTLKRVKNRTLIPPDKARKFGNERRGSISNSSTFTEQSNLIAVGNISLGDDDRTQNKSSACNSFDGVRKNSSHSFTSEQSQSSNQTLTPQEETFYQRTVSNLSLTLSHITSCGTSVVSVANCSSSTKRWDDLDERDTVSISDIFSPRGDLHLDEYARNHLQETMRNNPVIKEVIAQVMESEDEKKEDDSFKDIFHRNDNTVPKTPQMSENLSNFDGTSISSPTKSYGSSDQDQDWARFDDFPFENNATSTESLDFLHGEETLEPTTMLISSDSSEVKELINTYTRYRMKQQYIDNVVRSVEVILPMHFHVDKTKGQKLENITSEPHGSNFRVRGPTYLQDGIKASSGESIFALLGVDHILRNSKEASSDLSHSSEHKYSYRNRLKEACSNANVANPFLLIFNLTLPWGNIIAYMYRPDATDNGPFCDSKADMPHEKLWRKFLQSDNGWRDLRLKMIPRIVQGPWMVKKMVGSSPAVIGQKVPVTYFGSALDHYLEISMDITKGGSIANSIASTCAGKADSITVDIGFVIEGTGPSSCNTGNNATFDATTDCNSELPEVILGAFRLHHLDLKNGGYTKSEWIEEVSKERTNQNR